MATFRKFTLADGSTRIEARVHRRGLATVARRFRTRREAEAWARQTETSADRGQRSTTKAVRKTTVAEAVDAYLAEHNIPSKHRGAYHAVRLDLGEFAISGLTRKQLRGWLDLLAQTDTRRGSTYAPATLRRFFYAAKAALEWHATEVGYTLPVGLFDFPAPAAWAGQRDRRLLPGELQRLLTAAEAGAGGMDVPGDVMRDLIVLAVDTALRSQEIVYGEARDIGSNGRLWYVRPEIEKTKNGRLVPLGKPGREVVARRSKHKQGTTRLFPEIRNTDVISKAFARIVAAADCADLVFHDLRHEAISALAESRLYSLEEAMAITGHSNLTTFRRYLVFFGDRLASKRDN